MDALKQRKDYTRGGGTYGRENALLAALPESKRDAACAVLSHDPRPSYQRKPGRIYGLNFAGFDIRFTVEEDRLTVCEVVPL